MANKAKKPKAMRSIRSGKKTAQLIKNNQETIYNVWTTLNSLQVLKNS
jgi:hypothetical protein